MSKPLISYAQNFEDVRLWRALHAVMQGYYIDIGAQSPTVDSISRVFYENGWRGTHVDAMQLYADELREARPGDIVIHAAVAAASGTLAFYGIAETGLSTTQADVAERHRCAGFSVTETTVPAITLDDVLEQVGDNSVHWLKIDVEGGEKDVLLGWRYSNTRPWIVVIESTLPLTNQEAFEPWEYLIFAKGYTFAHFDGLNRYYVSELHPDLLESFLVPPNIFDNFALSTMSSTPFKREFVRQLDEAEAALAAETAALLATRAQFESVSAELYETHFLLGKNRGGLDAAKTNLLYIHEALRASREELVIQVQNAHWLQAQLDEGASMVNKLATQLDGSKAATMVLQQQLGLARTQIQEHSEIAHRWWVAAEGMTEELGRIYSSRSWRFTVMLRKARRKLGPRRLILAAYLGSKAAVRATVVAATRRLACNDLMRRAGRVVLGISPRLRERLRLSVIHTISPPANVSSTPSLRGAALVPRRKHSGELLGLRATHILDDLLNAIETARGRKR